MPSIDQVQLLSEDAICIMLDCSHSFIRQSVRSGALAKPLKLGARMSRWRLVDVQKFVTEQSGEAYAPEAVEATQTLAARAVRARSLQRLVTDTLLDAPLREVDLVDRLAVGGYDRTEIGRAVARMVKRGKVGTGIGGKLCVADLATASAKPSRPRKAAQPAAPAVLTRSRRMKEAA